MKTLLPLTAVLVLASGLVAQADSKRTAKFILSDPRAYEGKEITLDVAMVHPVKWVSPMANFAFFHARTLDRRDRKPGGSILVAVPADKSAAFAKKYGTNFEGRNQSTTLRGTLVAVGGSKQRPRPGIWIIDTTGNLLAEIDSKKASFPEGAFEGDTDGAPEGDTGLSMGKGQGRGPGPGMRRPRQQ
jgi:hypothetical protein